MAKKNALDNSRLLKHSFQFISFCYVYHEEASGGAININKDSHLIHVTRGTGTVVIGHKEYRLRRGMVVAIPRFEEFVLHLRADFEMLNIHYRLWLADGQSLDDSAILPFVFQPAYFDDAERTLRQMHGRLDKSPTLAPLAHELVLGHLTANRLTPRVDRNADARILEVYRKLLSADYHQFDAEELAGLCHLSVSQMNRIFFRYFRMSPQRFWNEHRFARVRLALKDRGRSIGDVGEAFGFEGQAYFSRWFKKLAGVSPAAYRNRLARSHIPL